VDELHGDRCLAHGGCHPFHTLRAIRSPFGSASEPCETLRSCGSNSATFQRIVIFQVGIRPELRARDRPHVRPQWAAVTPSRYLTQGRSISPNCPPNEPIFQNHLMLAHFFDRLEQSLNSGTVSHTRCSPSRRIVTSSDLPQRRFGRVSVWASDFRNARASPPEW